MSRWTNCIVETKKVEYSGIVICMVQPPKAEIWSHKLELNKEKVCIKKGKIVSFPDYSNISQI